MNNLRTVITDTTDDVLAQIGKVNPIAPPGSAKFETIVSWITWGAIIAAVVGLIIGGVLLAYERSQGSGGDAKNKIIGGMVGAVVIGVAAGIVNQLAL